MGKNWIAFGTLQGLILGGLLVSPIAAQAADPQLQITGASYGYAMERKDVKQDVAALCDGKPACSFLVKNETFTSKQPADPSPGNDKGLMVFWKCGDVAHKTQFAEGRKAKVDCE